MVQLVLYIIAAVIMFTIGYSIAYSRGQENDQYIKTLKSELADTQYKLEKSERELEQCKQDLDTVRSKLTMRIVLVARKDTRGDDDIAISSYVCIAKDKNEAYQMGPYGDYRPMLHSWPVTCKDDVDIICIGCTPNDKPIVVSISR